MNTIRSAQYDSDFFLDDIDNQLARAWKAMAAFCLMVNLAAESKSRIATETYLDTMASVTYRLLGMTYFEAGSTEEVIRLGLLAFASNVFLQWKRLGIRYFHLTTTYKYHLARLRHSDVLPQLWLWLLMVGAVSVFGPADDEWLKPWLRVNIEICGVESWSDMQGILKSLMWIDLIHDASGEDVYNSALDHDLVTPSLDPSPVSPGCV